MRNLVIKLRNRKGTKGQTALEYALVVMAISLVLMAAWNVVGKRVQEMIMGDMLPKLTDTFKKGNATVGR